MKNSDIQFDNAVIRINISTHRDIIMCKNPAENIATEKKITAAEDAAIKLEPYRYWLQKDLDARVPFLKIWAMMVQCGIDVRYHSFRRHIDAAGYRFWRYGRLVEGDPNRRGAV